MLGDHLELISLVVAMLTNQQIRYEAGTSGHFVLFFYVTALTMCETRLTCTTV
jgi:hypothetical protein